MSKIRALFLVALVTATFTMAGCSSLCCDPCDKPDCNPCDCNPCGCN